MNISKKLNSIETGILGAQNNPEIQRLISPFGYTPKRMRVGKDLLDEALSQVSKNVSEYGDQYVAHSDFEIKWQTAYSNYMITLKIVRVAFNSTPELLTYFCATGQRSKSLSGWLRESRIMYVNLLEKPEFINTIALYGVTKKRLETELQQVNEVETMHVYHLEQKGEAQQSTVDRDKAIDAVCKWYSEFRAIARIALYEKPQLLEALGIVKK